jgi:uncharacterized membrane protein
MRIFPPAGLLALLSTSCAPAGDAPESTPSPTAFPAKFTGLGTEPFWSIVVDGTTLVWSSMNDPVERRATVSRLERGGILRLAGSLDGKPMSATLWQQQCSDGMSDRRYPYALEVKIGQQKLSGCARR